jgi:predicted transcriptional regulator
MKTSIFKNLEPFIISLLAVFAPIKGILLTVGFIILVDLITGIIAARKRGEKITSAALRRTVSKALIYQTAVLTGFLIETYLTGDLVPITKVVASIIGVVEGTSVFENLNAISDNKIFSKVLEKLGSINDKKKEEPPKDDSQS